MKHPLTVRCLCLTLLISACAIVPVYSADVTVGLLAGSNKLGEVEEAAYDWAKDNFKTTTLLVDKSGNFKNAGGTALQPENFAVLWMFYTETNTLPDPFLADATKKAVLDYVEAGGSMFLSALALRYVFELDVDDGGDPRVFQPLGKGPPEIGVIPTADGKNHPVFEGFDTSKPIFLTSMQQDGFTSDFFNFGDDPSGTILGTKTRGGGAGGGERPFVEYEVGDGIVITLGHHNGVYTDAKSKEGDNLRKLTANVLNYLGENSEFFPVEPTGKLATTWGNLKALFE
ncbi:hypothetical protein J5I95_02960 [Candidatus Poribacteria bacterium]|nr:hypothetical protein [Candidatus Poribacteria bacterium]